MSRSTKRTKRKPQPAPNPHGGAKAELPGVLTLDPATEQEVTRLFVNLMKRMLITILVMAVVAVAVVSLSGATRNAGVGVFFLSVVFGLLISFWRRVGAAFMAVRQLGIERWKQRRYADAIYALEHFHRVGNMSFDANGEAHYYLTLAYLALGQTEKASLIEAWMRRYRPRSAFTPRATAAIASAPQIMTANGQT